MVDFNESYLLFVGCGGGGCILSTMNDQNTKDLTWNKSVADRVVEVVFIAGLTLAPFKVPPADTFSCLLVTTYCSLLVTLTWSAVPSDRVTKEPWLH